MNRKQRRRLGIKEKKKSYVVTEDTFGDIRKTAFTRGIEEMVSIEIFITIMVLRDFYGFGKKRLSEFVKHHRDLLDSIEKDYVDYTDLINTVKEETGFDYFANKDVEK